MLKRLRLWLWKLGLSLQQTFCDHRWRTTDLGENYAWQVCRCGSRRRVLRSELRLRSKEGRG